MTVDHEARTAANRARLLALVPPEPVVSDAEADDLLRPTACPRCDYPLAGLPAAGVCPECGRAYDASAVYLYGFAAGTKAKQWTAKPASPWRTWVGWAINLGALAVMVGAFRWHLRWTDLAQFWYLPMGIIGMAIAAWRRTTDTGSGLVRVTLGPAGVSQADRSFGPVPFDRADRKRPVPWARVRRAKVVAAGDGEVRVTLSSSDEFWSFRRDYVDATVRATPEQVAAVRARVAQWRSAAASGA